MGSAIPKQYLPIIGRSVLEHCLGNLLEWGKIDFLIISTRDQDRHRVQQVLEHLSPAIPVQLAPGGAERAESVANALSFIDAARFPFVFIHDGVRPFVPHQCLQALLDALDRSSGACLALAARDTLKLLDTHSAAGLRTLDRSRIWQAQTPQAFATGVIRMALEQAGRHITDDASALERAGIAVELVPGSPLNLKITTPEDLLLAQAIAGCWHQGAARLPDSV